MELTSALLTLGQDGNLKFLNVDLPERFYTKIAICSKKLESIKRMPAITPVAFYKIVQEKKKKLKELEICSDFFPHAIRLIPQLKNLTFLGIHSKTFNAFEILPQLKHLKSLDIFLSLPALKELGPRRFKQSLPVKCLQNLESVKFHLAKIETDSQNIHKIVLKIFAEACPNLRNLRISYAEKRRNNLRDFEDWVSLLLPPFTGACPRLETMIMDVGYTSKDPLQFLRLIHKQLPSIRLIHLSTSDFVAMIKYPRPRMTKICFTTRKVFLRLNAAVHSLLNRRP